MWPVGVVVTIMGMYVYGGVAAGCIKPRQMSLQSPPSELAAVVRRRSTRCRCNCRLISLSCGSAPLDSHCPQITDWLSANHSLHLLHNDVAFRFHIVIRLNVVISCI